MTNETCRCAVTPVENEARSCCCGPACACERCACQGCACVETCTCADCTCR